MRIVVLAERQDELGGLASDANVRDLSQTAIIFSRIIFIFYRIIFIFA